jgi:DNA helicase-2/ATP-dependent DNA helicase PcrA
LDEIDRILAPLNPEQREAVRFVEGPLLVLAGAGSGKTRALTHRIAHLIACGAARPFEILAVTFTNKAAREMRERVDALLEERARGVWVATFHSTCVRILRREIQHLGYQRSFAIYDDADSRNLTKRVLRALELDERSYPPRAVHAQIDRLKNRGLLPADLRGEPSSDRFPEVYQRYQLELRRANALDFGDLLVQTVRLFQNHPGVLAGYQRRWRFILVDEYQDTNPVQYELLSQLAREHRNLCVVGDEDQSIYRFREADIRNILDFEKDFPGAHVVRLERNYRSTQPILDAASAVVANNRERKGKRLYTDRREGTPIRFYQAMDDRAEAVFVVQELLRLREEGARLGGMAIFYRTHAQSRPFEEELLKYDVPYVVVGGTRFYDRAEVKDALAYLRVLRNPDDTESLLRIVNKPARGIGRTTIERLLQQASGRDESLFRALGRASEHPELRGPATRRIAQFLALLDDLRASAERAGPGELLGRVLDRTGYLRALEEDGSLEAESRRENLAELLAAVEEFERQNAPGAGEAPAEDGGGPAGLLDLFLEQVTLLSEADQFDEDLDRVPLMTAHVAKGLEFPTVFLVGMEEGLCPHFASLGDPSAIEEERRLCYVGMTRAMDRLYITNATMRRLHGGIRYNPPSRFLAEIPPELGVGRELDRRPALAADPGAPAAPVRARSLDPEREIDYSLGQWAPHELPPVEVGMRVEHPVFGAGTIAQVAGSGAATKLRIRFDRAGQKTIVLRYAELRLLA